jgi:glyoxylase-like metal-dependent hydrolase (beta-lactamase superfamily II)
MLQIASYILLPSFQTNTWLLWDNESGDAILIDPAAPDRALAAKLEQLKVHAIVNTHGHADHIGGNSYFKNICKCPVMIHAADALMLTSSKKNLSAYMDSPIEAPAADRILNDGDTIAMGNHQIKVIHTPGHTPGSICLLVQKYLISGDTLFEQSIGRTDFPGGSHSAIIASILDKLFILPDDTIVYPGHGPRTSIGLEKTNNPFVR